MPEALARTGICEETIRCGLTDEAAASNQTQEVNIVYRKVDTNLNFVDREKEVEKFWKDNKIFEKSMDSRKEGETDRKSTRLNSSHLKLSRMPSSA